MCVYGLITFIQQIGHINRVWLSRGQLTGKIDSELETENRNTLQILASLGPFAVNALSHHNA